MIGTDFIFKNSALICWKSFSSSFKQKILVISFSPQQFPCFKIAFENVSIRFPSPFWKAQKSSHDMCRARWASCCEWHGGGTRALAASEEHWVRFTPPWGVRAWWEEEAGPCLEVAQHKLLELSWVRRAFACRATPEWSVRAQDGWKGHPCVGQSGMRFQSLSRVKRASTQGRHRRNTLGDGL